MAYYFFCHKFMLWALFCVLLRVLDLRFNICQVCRVLSPRYHVPISGSSPGSRVPLLGFWVSDLGPYPWDRFRVSGLGSRVAAIVPGFWFHFLDMPETIQYKNL